MRVVSSDSLTCSRSRGGRRDGRFRHLPLAGQGVGCRRLSFQPDLPVACLGMVVLQT